MHALIQNNEVVEIIDFDPEGRFHPSMVWVKFDGRRNIEVGDIYENDEFRKPEIDLNALRDDALMRIDRAADTARRAGKSTGETLDEEYKAVNSALEEYRISPKLNAPLPIRIHADVFGVNVETAARDIAEAAGRNEDCLMTVRRIRLEGKQAVKTAKSNFDEVARPYIDKLRALV